MGSRSSRANVNDWDWNEIEQNTGLSTQQIRQIQEEFFSTDEQNSGLNMNQFPDVYVRLFGPERQQDLDEQTVRIFETLDRDRTGIISFDEFLSAIIMMNHEIDHSDRIDYLIRQYNIEGRQQDDGCITSQYGHKVFRRLNDYYGLPPGTEHDCWKTVDKENRGHVTQEEIMNYISQQKVYNR